MLNLEFPYTGYSINSILYQRGIYDPELFKPVKKYKLRMMVTKDKGLDDYLKNVLQQLTAWLEKGMVQKLVLVITAVDSEETLERWVFDVDTDQACVNEGCVFYHSFMSALARRRTDGLCSPSGKRWKSRKRTS